MPICACLLLAMLVMSSMMTIGSSPQNDLPGDDDRMTLDPFSVEQDVMFLENRGQWDADILFAARTTFGHMAFGRDFMIFDVKEEMAGPVEEGPESGTILNRGTVIRMDLKGTTGTGPAGVGRSATRTNIIHGKDPSKWGIGLGSYGSLVYRDIWDGIDLMVGPKDGQVKYDFIVSPYTNMGDIRFTMSGMSSIDVAPDGIMMMTPHGSELTDRDLVSFYRDSPGCIIGSSFVEHSDGTIGFSVVGRDPSRTLVIDPVIYSTYIGGTDREAVIDMVVGNDGACYIAGSTYSFDLQTTPGAYSGSSAGEMDGFVMKLYTNGSVPELSTYIGGGWSDQITALDIDGTGNIYLAGFTTSQDYPITKGAFNETQYGIQSDIVVTKLDPTGSTLLYSTYLGGNDSEAMDNRGTIEVDSSGNLYLTGTSWSGNFPVTDDAFDKENKEIVMEDHTYRNGKVVLVKLDPEGSDLLYSTYIGGTSWDTAYGLELDGNDDVYIMGQTSSSDFPVTENAFDTSMDSWSAVFVLKFDVPGSDLLYSTMLEGYNYQVGRDLLVDGEGRAYVIGDTGSDDFPMMPETYQNQLLGWSDIFVTAFDPTGSSLYLSTLIGGSDGEQGYGIDLDPEGNILITGMTYSTDYPSVVVNKDDTTDRDPDMVISKLDSTARSLIYSTVLGGRGKGIDYPEDKGVVISYLSSKRVIVSGMTGSKDFPVSVDAWDGTMVDDFDDFLMEFDISLPPSAPRELSLERGDGFLNLSWAAPETDGGMPIDGYCIFKGTSEDELKQLKLLVGDLFYNDTELSMGSRYFYMVAAQNGVGQGPPSDIVSAGAASSPTPPQFLQLQKGDSWVKLTWVPPVFDGASIMTAYRVYRTAEEGPETMTELDPFAYRFIDEEVENGKNYSYRMTAVNSIGESEPTQTLWVIPSGAPSPPVDLTVQNGPMSVVLSWSPPADDGGSKVLFYRVHIGIEQDGSVQWRYSDSPVATFTDHLVEIGMSYRYYVTAVSSEGESEPSEEVTGRPCSEPSTPEGFQVTEGNGYCNLVWSMPTFLGGLDLAGYRVLRSQVGTDMVVMAELGPETYSFKDRNVTNGIRYSYVLVAFNTYGASKGTEPRTGVPAAVPGVPVGLSARVDNGTVVLTWGSPVSDGGAGITEQRVFRQLVGEELLQIASVAPTVLTYNDTDAAAGETYSYCVKAVNRMGSSLSSEKVTVLVTDVPSPPVEVKLSTDDGKVVISWGAPLSEGGSPITGFVIERYDQDLNDLLIISNIGASSRSFTDDTVVNGMTYTYHVMAESSVGTSEPAISGPVTPLGRPGTPTSLVLAERKGHVVIGWMSPESDGGSDILFYRIYRSVGDGPKVLVGLAEAGLRSYNDDVGSEPGEYSYQVAAVNDIGESRAPAEGSIEVKGVATNEDLIGDNIGLIITVPLILVLSVLIVVLLFRRRKVDTSTVPQPTPVPVMNGTDPVTNGTYPENVTMFEQAMDNEQ